MPLRLDDEALQKIELYKLTVAATRSTKLLVLAQHVSTQKSTSAINTLLYLRWAPKETLNHLNIWNTAQMAR